MTYKKIIPITVLALLAAGTISFKLYESGETVDYSEPPPVKEEISTNTPAPDLLYGGRHYTAGNGEKICDGILPQDFDDSILDGLEYLGKTNKVESYDAMKADLDVTVYQDGIDVYLVDEEKLENPGNDGTFLCVYLNEDYNQITAYYYP